MTARSIFSAMAFVAASGVAFADNMPCSIHPPKGTPKSDLAAMARISQADAEKAAVARTGGQSDAVQKVELEVEDGCLVYEVKVKGSDDRVREVMVDAGDGKILTADDKHDKE